MSHIRAQIRSALVARLGGLATTGTNVFANRMEILSDPELPALLIMTDGEMVKNRAVGSQAAPHARMELRTESFKVRACAKANTGLDDTLDEICLEVEKAIAADIFMGGLTDDARLMQTVYQLDASGEHPEGTADMIWELSPWVSNTTPDTRA